MIVVVVALKGDKFLMVKHPQRGWEFPGGKVEKNEKLEQAAVRECMEEAGVKIKNTKKIVEERNMVVFGAEISEILPTHEMERKFFIDLPESLSFGKEEGEKFLKIAKVNLSSSR